MTRSGRRSWNSSASGSPSCNRFIARRGGRTRSSSAKRFNGSRFPDNLKAAEEPNSARVRKVFMCRGEAEPAFGGAVALLGPIFVREGLTLPRRTGHYVARTVFLGFLWVLGLTLWQVTVGWDKPA